MRMLIAEEEERNRCLHAVLWALTLTLALLFAHTAQAQAKASRFFRLSGLANHYVLHSRVVRGNRHRFTLRALAGEKLSVHVTAREHNAAFQIIGPGGRALPGAGEGDDAMRWQGRLPVTGVYTVVVGGTRGNAAYTLTINLPARMPTRTMQFPTDPQPAH